MLLRMFIFCSICIIILLMLSAVIVVYISGICVVQ